MSFKAKNMFVLGITLIVVMIVGYLGIAFVGNLPPFQTTTPINQCTNGSSNYPYCNNNVPPVTTATGIYAGSVSFLVTPVWAYSGAASNEGTNDPTYNIYHANKALIGAITITSHIPVATTLTVAPEDNGVVYMSVMYSATAQTYIVDPAMTMAQNTNWITGYTANTDLDHNGQYELLFKLNLLSIKYNVGQTPSVQINLYDWKVDTATVTTLSNPTFSVAAGGDLDITGYMLYAGGAGYVLPVAQINVWMSHTNAANTTASSLSTIIASSGFWLVSFRLQGVGAQTSTTYGQTWAAPTYDPSNTRYVMFQANDAHDGAPGTVDVHQPNWAMLFVYERSSGATWLQWDIKCHASAAALTASKAYYVYIEFLVLTSTGSSASEGYKATITTTA
jgi:hypothetical protein